MYVSDYLVKVAQSVLKDGYHKSYESEPTWEVALDISISHTTTDAEVLANRALKWISTINPKDEYESKLQLICKSYEVKYEELPIVASLITSYQRNQKIQDKYKAIIAENEMLAETSNYQGVVGNKLEVDVIDVKRRVFSGYYGDSTFFRFLDADGNVYIWSTTSYIPDDMEITHIIGTVKEHSTYQGIKQTYLKRVKVS